ncbi:hypothetical protein E2P63_06595, partial [Candidatus Bathyarchaeota archaeon]
MVFGSEQTQALLNAYKLNYKKFPFNNSPLEIFSKLQKRYETTYLLESIEGPKKLAQYSFIGFAPSLTIQIKNGNTEIRNKKTDEIITEKTSDPLHAIAKLVKGKKVLNSNFRFVGGAVGYISYDAIRYWEKLPQKSRDDLNFPDAQLGFFDDGIVFDHKQKSAFYYYSGNNRFTEVEALMTQPCDTETLEY